MLGCRQTELPSRRRSARGVRVVLALDCPLVKRREVVSGVSSDKSELVKVTVTVSPIPGGCGKVMVRLIGGDDSVAVFVERFIERVSPPSMSKSPKSK